jgi:hypothetical protein
MLGSGATGATGLVTGPGLGPGNAGFDSPAPDAWVWRSRTPVPRRSPNPPITPIPGCTPLVCGDAWQASREGFDPLAVHAHVPVAEMV